MNSKKNRVLRCSMKLKGQDLGANLFHSIFINSHVRYDCKCVRQKMKQFFFFGKNTNATACRRLANALEVLIDLQSLIRLKLRLLGGIFPLSPLNVEFFCRSWKAKFKGGFRHSASIQRSVFRKTMNMRKRLEQLKQCQQVIIAFTYSVDCRHRQNGGERFPLECIEEEAWSCATLKTPATVFRSMGLVVLFILHYSQVEGGAEITYKEHTICFDWHGLHVFHCQSWCM